MPAEKTDLPHNVTVSLASLTKGDEEGIRYPVTAAPTYIGRGQDNDVILTGVGVAETHARMSVENGDLFLEDLGTGGVTMVNESMIKKTKLRNADIIGIGETRLLLQLAAPPGGIKLSGQPEQDERVAAGESSPPGKEAGPDQKGPGPVWSVGFKKEFRSWFGAEMGEELEIETRAIRTGEEALVAMSAALENGAAPATVILDLKIPIINGINVAISIRALELGYRKRDRIPLVFLFDPPETGNFDKVMKFCQPVKLLKPGATEDDLKDAARMIAKKASLK